MMGFQVGRILKWMSRIEHRFGRPVNINRSWPLRITHWRLFWPIQYRARIGITDKVKVRDATPTGCGQIRTVAHPFNAMSKGHASRTFDKKLVVNDPDIVGPAAPFVGKKINVVPRSHIESIILNRHVHRAT